MKPRNVQEPLRRAAGRGIGVMVMLGVSAFAAAVVIAFVLVELVG